MPNKAKGEVGFEAGGKAYTLVYTINALCELEGILGDGAAAAGLGTEGALSVRRLRAFLWAGLQRHHKGISLDAAGDIIGTIGPTRAVLVVGEAMAAAFPENAGGPLEAAAPTAAVATG